MNHTREQKSLGIDQQIALAARDQLAAIKAVGIPLFPAVFTLWLSRIAAVGLFFRPCFCRVFSRSTS
jgi:hypothetical protein